MEVQGIDEYDCELNILSEHFIHPNRDKVGVIWDVTQLECGPCYHGQGSDLETKVLAVWKGRLRCKDQDLSRVAAIAFGLEVRAQFHRSREDALELWAALQILKLLVNPFYLDSHSEFDMEHNFPCSQYEEAAESKSGLHELLKLRDCSNSRPKDFTMLAQRQSSTSMEAERWSASIEVRDGQGAGYGPDETNDCRRDSLDTSPAFMITYCPIFTIAHSAQPVDERSGSPPSSPILRCDCVPTTYMLPSQPRPLEATRNLHLAPKTPTLSRPSGVEFFSMIYKASGFSELLRRSTLFVITYVYARGGQFVDEEGSGAASDAVQAVEADAEVIGVRGEELDEGGVEDRFEEDHPAGYGDSGLQATAFVGPMSHEKREHMAQEVGGVSDRSFLFEVGDGRKTPDGARTRYRSA
ncbi:hypothetical protein R3P38DRAFT_2757331 [Favolaschia claudopus]|uniref:Exonuclease domain-containing protein n=1 Tax=Favolaschia claudopus TaxID=2862362 RepID=A0AAW0EK27_9AGAR